MNLVKLFPLALLAALAPACAVQTTDEPPMHEEVGAAREADTETVFSDMTLNAGDTIYSYDGRTFLIMQDDGNLVLYFAPFGQSAWAEELWASNTSGNPGAHATMQAGGNLVVFGPRTCTSTPFGQVCDNPVLWQSNTSNVSGEPRNYASVQNDGNFVIYSGLGGALWATGSNLIVPPPSYCVMSGPAPFCPAGSWWGSCSAASDMCWGGDGPYTSGGGCGTAAAAVMTCNPRHNFFYAPEVLYNGCSSSVSSTLTNCTNDDGTLKCTTSSGASYTAPTYGAGYNVE